MRFLRRLSYGCIYAGCYTAWAWVCMVLTASSLDQSEVHAIILFFGGAAAIESLRAWGDTDADKDYWA